MTGKAQINDSARRIVRRMRVYLVGTVLASLLVPATSLAGNWEWWGYRTNHFQTWALATQSPSYTRSVIPGFSQAVYVMAVGWRLNAQNALRMGLCTGLTWTATPIYVGCSSR
jgi:hypothetical protein